MKNEAQKVSLKYPSFVQKPTACYLLISNYQYYILNDTVKLKSYGDIQIFLFFHHFSRLPKISLKIMVKPYESCLMIVFFFEITHFEFNKLFKNLNFDACFKVKFYLWSARDAPANERGGIKLNISIALPPAARLRSANVMNRKSAPKSIKV